MLKTRILSALVLAPPALLAAWAGGIAFDLLVALAAVLMAWEWERLTTGRFGLDGILLAVMGGLVALLGSGMPAISLALVAGFAVLLAGLSAARKANPAWNLFGALYVGVPVIALVWLRSYQGGLETLVWLFLVIWATDIGAYAAGRTIGGPKLAPRISPKKTWAGLLGGAASAILVGVGVALAVEGANPLVLGLVSGILAVIAQGGDLGESWVKRHFDVKDSSNIIPGHGGVLDRVDGLLAAAPVAALLVWVLGGGVTVWR